MQTALFSARWKALSVGVALLMVVNFAMLSPSTARAAALTWTFNGSGQGYWSSSANWGNHALSTVTPNDLYFSSSLGTNSVNNVNNVVNVPISSINFGPSSISYNLSGQTILLGSAGTAGGSIFNASPNAQIIALGIKVNGFDVIGTSGGAITLSGIISGTGNLQLSGGSIALKGNNTGFTGMFDLAGGTTSYSSVGALGKGTLSVDANSTLQANVAGAVTTPLFINSGDLLNFDTHGYSTSLTGNIMGGGTLNKSGNGVLILSRTDNSYGATELSGGTLIYSNAHALDGGPIQFMPGSAVLQPGGGGIALANPVNLGGVSTLAYFNAPQGYAATLSGSVTGFALMKVGAGTLTLTNAANNFNLASILAGTLQATNVKALPTQMVTDNGTLAFNLSTPGTYGGFITTTGSAGVVAVSGSSLLTLTHTNNYTSTSLNGGSVNYAVLGALGTGPITATTNTSLLQAGVAGALPNNMTLNGGLTFDTQGYAVTLSGSLSGPGGLAKFGTGTLTIPGNDSYHGATTLNNGTLLLTGSLANSIVVGNSGATFIAMPTSGVAPVAALTFNAGSNFVMTSGSDTVASKGGATFLNSNLTFALGGNISDNIAAKGGISLGGKDVVTILPGNLALTSSIYTLITAPSGLTGRFLQFANGTQNSEFYAGGQIYQETLHALGNKETLTLTIGGSGHVPWANNEGFPMATAAVGIEPNTAGALTNFGPAVLSPSFSAGDTLTNIQYAPGTFGNPPAYLLAWSSSNMGYNGVNHYPTGPDQNNPGGNISPASGAPLNSYGGTGTGGTNSVGAFVSSTVTSISGGYTSDPNPTGIPISLSNNTGWAYAPGANAAIIAGNFMPSAPGVTQISMAWRTRSATEMNKNTPGGNPNLLPTAAAYLASEVVKVQGQKQGFDYVFQMDFNNAVETPGDQAYDVQANKALFLGILNNDGAANARWVNAVLDNVATVAGPNGDATMGAVGTFAWQPGNYDYSTHPASVSNQPFLGSFAQFLSSQYTMGSGSAQVTGYFYEHSLDELRGTWGVDTSTDTAWAVLDVGGGIFAVVPEPATIRLMAACLMTAGIGVWWRRRSRVKAAKAGTVKPATKRIAYRAAA